VEEAEKVLVKQHKKVLMLWSTEAIFLFLSIVREKFTFRLNLKIPPQLNDYEL
jgi:hypothetical protein